MNYFDFFWVVGYLTMNYFDISFWGVGFILTNYFDIFLGVGHIRTNYFDIVLGCRVHPDELL